MEVLRKRLPSVKCTLEWPRPQLIGSRTVQVVNSRSCVRRAVCPNTCSIYVGFCQMPNVTARMRDVRKHFDAAEECHSVAETRDNDLPWSFIGVHRHPSGTTIEIVHIAG